MTCFRLLLCLLMVGVLTLPAHAQTVTCGTGTPVNNPTKVTFNASPDHAVTQNGTNVVTNYTLDIYKSSDGSKVGSSIDLLKPAPVGGVITVTAVPQTLAKDTAFCAVVNAVGPGGTGPSVPSGPFLFPTPLPAPRAPGLPTLQ